ncbi:MAG: hypothetical protein HEP71_15660 [Roseivirga sp.]|nr:hypothetical protein [Roseivirga sp.]
MKRSFLILLLISLSLPSFAQDSKIRRQSFDSYRELDSTSYLLIPIEWDNSPRVGEIKVAGAGRKQNIFFYDPETEENRFLFDGRMQIIEGYKGHLLNSRYKGDTSKRPLNKEHIYYSVINQDYNEDKKLDSNDPSYLYMSRFDGTGLIRLTPESYDLQTYRYIERSNIILATLTYDENQDGKFNNNDTAVLYKIDLNDLSKSKEVTKLRLKVNPK